MTVDSSNIVPSALSKIDYLIKNNTHSYKYTLSELIMFLLYADRTPIRGKIRQMKEVFLFLTLILKGKDVQPLLFDKKRYGPHSELVEYAIDQLIISNCISGTGKKSIGDFTIELTPKGRNIIHDKYKELPFQVRSELEESREKWDTHIPSGLINFVYTHYPEFLDRSVFKKRYPVLDWTDENQKKT